MENYKFKKANVYFSPNDGTNQKNETPHAGDFLVDVNDIDSIEERGELVLFVYLTYTHTEKDESLIASGFFRIGAKTPCVTNVETKVKLNKKYKYTDKNVTEKTKPYHDEFMELMMSEKINHLAKIMSGSVINEDILVYYTKEEIEEAEKLSCVMGVIES